MLGELVRLAGAKGLFETAVAVAEEERVESCLGCGHLYCAEGYGDIFSICEERN
jgi:hypothetical protein